MKLSTIWAALILAAAVIFTLLNLGLVLEPRSVRLPGSTFTTPVVGILVAASVVAVLLMLAVHAADLALRARAYGRLETRLAQRERELADMKSRAYDEVSAQIDALRQDLSRQIGELHRIVEERSGTTEHAGVHS